MRCDERGVDDDPPPERPEPLSLREAGSLDEPRIDGVDGDAPPAQLERRRPRERQLGVLRGGVGAVGDGARNRDDVDDVRAGNEPRQERAQHPNRAEVVRPRHVLDPAEVGVEEPSAGGNPGVVHEQVDPRMAFEHPRRDRGSTAVAVGDVAFLVLVCVRRGPAREPDHEPAARCATRGRAQLRFPKRPL